MRTSIVLLLILAVTNSRAGKAADPPTEWIEPSTGHRVIRLSRESGTSSFYFHQNGYTESGDKLVVSTRDGLASIDLSKHDYKLEPNVTFTPDGKWIVFRSNMRGAVHVYAVEIRKKADGPR